VCRAVGRPHCFDVEVTLDYFSLALALPVFGFFASVAPCPVRAEVTSRYVPRNVPRKYSNGMPAKLKLTNEQVRRIRRRVRAGERVIDLADEFGVNRKTIRRRLDALERGTRWVLLPKRPSRDCETRLSRSI
jgi:hypothetical protein